MQIPAQGSDAAAGPAGWDLRRLRARDDASWRAAYRELWPLALGVVSRRVFSRESAEDLAQQTLAAIADRLNSFADERHIRVMTVVIAQRQAAHFLRDETAARRDRRREVALDAAYELGTIDTSAQQALDLNALLACLPVLDRNLLQGHFMEGLSSQELAVRHNLNANTVRGRMKRALDRLQSEQAGGPRTDQIPPAEVSASIQTR